MDTDITIKGIEPFIAALNRLPDDIAKKSGEKALRDGAKVLLEKTQDLVPEGRTGKLADSLAIAVVKADYPKYRLFAKRRKGFGGWHAHLVEFGTKPHWIGKKWHKGSPPKPFMRPALLNNKNQIIKAVFENIFSHITNVIKKEMK